MVFVFTLCQGVQEPFLYCAGVHIEYHCAAVHVASMATLLGVSRRCKGDLGDLNLEAMLA